MTATPSGTEPEMHINPATGYMEEVASLDEAAASEAPNPAPSDSDLGDETEDEMHINPATGFVEGIAHQD
jgi:hypothetical protein